MQRDWAEGAIAKDEDGWTFAVQTVGAGTELGSGIGICVGVPAGRAGAATTGAVGATVGGTCGINTGVIELPENEIGWE
jgi:hypothetical protein